MNIPEGWQLVPVELTAENGMKAALMGEFRVSTAIGDFIVPWDTIKKIHRAMVAAAPTPPDDEPVAWHVKDAAFKEYNGTSEFYGRDKAFFNAGFDAGYKRRPDNGELRKAAEEALRVYKNRSDNFIEIDSSMKNLRAALDKGKSC